MSNDSAIREAAVHITGAAATVEVVANEFRAALREGRLDAFRRDRQFWRYELAKAAMQGMVGNEHTMKLIHGEVGQYTAEQIIASDAVAQADALLAELEREKGESDG